MPTARVREAAGSIKAGVKRLRNPRARQPTGSRAREAGGSRVNRTFVEIDLTMRVRDVELLDGYDEYREFIVELAKLEAKGVGRTVEC